MLSRDELAQLIGIMRDVFQYIGGLRSENQLAEYVQYPKIPPSLSEPLALHLISDGLILDGIRDLRLGGRDEADIVGRNAEGREVRIEVKGTGSSAWVYLGPKDYSAEYLLWISFGDFFENMDRRTINLHIARPSEIPGRRQRITLRALSQMLGDQLYSIEFDLASYLGE